MTIETSKTDKQRKNTEKKKKDQSIYELWDTYERYNIVIDGKARGEERNRRDTLENDDDNFPKLMWDKKAHVQEAQRPPNTIKTTTWRPWVYNIET